ncbi:MAG: hypothetical protein ACYS17_15475 [Planctomycetota bacterium]|jgi:hypothetical protein
MGIQHRESGYLRVHYLRAYKAPLRRTLGTLYSCRECSTNSLFYIPNKPNFPHFSPENEDYAKKQSQFKANSNPIKANYGQNKANQSQTNPIVTNLAAFLSYFRLHKVFLRTKL